MIKLYNDGPTKDFSLVLQSSPSIVLKCHLFLLAARTAYFEGLAQSPMIESQQMQSTFDLREGVTLDTF